MNMKKYICLLVSILVCIMSACSPYTCAEDTSVHQTEYDEIIDSGKYYCVYKGSITRVYYNIYDKNGNIALSEETERPLEIKMLNDNVVDIAIGVGTGITIHKYYNVEENIFSQEFSYVLSNLDEMVAYIAVPKEKPMENRKIIVQNIFDRNLFYKEFLLDFSNVDTPVIEANFSTDGEALQLTYLCGEEQTQVATILSLS